MISATGGTSLDAFWGGISAVDDFFFAEFFSSHGS